VTVPNGASVTSCISYGVVRILRRVLCGVVRNYDGSVLVDSKRILDSSLLSIIKTDMIPTRDGGIYL
jgi:hypothetical protein